MAKAKPGTYVKDGKPTIKAITLLAEAFRIQNSDSPNDYITMETKEQLQSRYPEYLTSLHAMILSNGNLGERIHDQGSEFVNMNDRARAIAFNVYQQTN